MNIASINPDAPGLQIKIEDGVCRIGINGPSRCNAMNFVMWSDLASCVNQASSNDEVKVVVVHGVGVRAFSSGADISEFAAKRFTAAQIEQYDDIVDNAQHSLIACTKPTVALINGICIGGGMVIAAACDLRYSRSTAHFQMPAARLGLGYSLSGLTRMIDIIGVSQVLDIFLTARTFDGLEAARIGFVQDVFSEDKYDAAVKSRVSALVDNAPLTLAAVKLAALNILNRTDSTTSQDVQRALATCVKSQDYLEGQLAFQEKRKPIFVGK